jgi:hypothetical protein
MKQSGLKLYKLCDVFDLCQEYLSNEYDWEDVGRKCGFFEQIYGDDFGGIFTTLQKSSYFLSLKNGELIRTDNQEFIDSTNLYMLEENAIKMTYELLTGIIEHNIQPTQSIIK